MPAGAVPSPAPPRSPLPGVRGAAGSGLAAPAWAVPPGPARGPAREAPDRPAPVTVRILAVFSWRHHQRLLSRGTAPAASLLTRPPSTGRDSQTRPYLKPPQPSSAPHTPPGQFARSYTGGAAHLLRHRGSPSASPSRLQARFASPPPASRGREDRPASPDGAGTGAGGGRGRVGRGQRAPSAPPAPQQQGEAGWAASGPRWFQGAASPARAGAGVRASGEGKKEGRKEGEGEGKDGKGSP